MALRKMVTNQTQNRLFVMLLVRFQDYLQPIRTYASRRNKIRCFHILSDEDKHLEAPDGKQICQNTLESPKNGDD